MNNLQSLSYYWPELLLVTIILTAVIYDLMGKEVARFNEVKNNELDIRHLSNGIYYLQMYMDDGSLLLPKKFIKN